MSISGLAFAADYFSVRFNVPNRTLFDNVEVRQFYAVKLKGNKTSYTFGPPQTVECVNALFPHQGDTPCWYRKSHTRIEVDINAGPPRPLIDTP